MTGEQYMMVRVCPGAGHCTDQANSVYSPGRYFSFLFSQGLDPALLKQLQRIRLRFCACDIYIYFSQGLDPVLLKQLQRTRLRRPGADGPVAEVRMSCALA